MKMSLVIAFAALGLVALSSQANAFDVHKIEYQKVERFYAVHNQEAADQDPVPVIILLHGYRKREQAIGERDNPTTLMWQHLNDQATEAGIAVAYPAAHWGQWSLSQQLENIRLHSGEILDDVGFISLVAEELVGEGVADPQKIYLVGISDGAIFSYRLLCAPDMPFAAAALLIGSMTENDRTACEAVTPVPLMVIAGTNDRILPYDGWIFESGREISIAETMDHWRNLHGCTGQRSRLLDDLNTQDHSRVREVEWTGCRQAGAVRLLRVEGGGHTKPAFEPVSDSWLRRAGGHNQDIDSAREVLKFIGEFRREKP